MVCSGVDLENIPSICLASRYRKIVSVLNEFLFCACQVLSPVETIQSGSVFVSCLDITTEPFMMCIGKNT